MTALVKNISDTSLVLEGPSLAANGDFSSAPSFVAPTTTPARWIDGTAAGSLTNNTWGWSFQERTGNGSAQFDSGRLKLSITSINSAVNCLSARIYNDAASIIQNAIPVRAGLTYTLTFLLETNAISGSSAGGARIEVSQYNSSGALVVGLLASSPYVSTTTSNTSYSVSFTVPAGTSYVALSPRLIGNTGAATLIMDAWYDEVRLYGTGLAKTSGRTSKDDSYGLDGVPLSFNNLFENAPVGTTPQTTGNRWLNGTAGGTTTNTNGWAMYNYDGSGYRALIDRAESVSGLASLKLSLTVVNSSVGVGTDLSDAPSFAMNQIPCLPNTRYSFSVMIKTNILSGSAATGARVILNQLTSAGAGAGAALTLSAGSATIGWTRFQGFITTSATALFFRVQANLRGDDGAATLIGDAWFDNFFIQVDSIVKSPRKNISDTPVAKDIISNLISNPSFEVDLSGWLGVQGAVITREAKWSTDGSYSMKIASSGVNFAQARPNNGVNIPVIGGQTYVFQGYVSVEVPHTPGSNGLTLMRPYIYWKNSVGATVGETDFGAPNLNVARDRLLVTMTRVAPATAVTGQFSLFQYGIGGAWYDDISIGVMGPSKSVGKTSIDFTIESDSIVKNVRRITSDSVVAIDMYSKTHSRVFIDSVSAVDVKALSIGKRLSDALTIDEDLLAAIAHFLNSRIRTHDKLVIRINGLIVPWYRDDSGEWQVSTSSEWYEKDSNSWYEPNR